MLVTLSLPDSLAEAYKSHALPGKTLETTLTDQLTRFASCFPAERFLVIGAKDREELEAATTKLPFMSAAQLVAAVKKLSEVSVGGIRLGWTPLQLEEVKVKAARWGLTPEAWVEANVRRILEEQILSTNPRPGEMLAAGRELAVAAAAKK